MKALLILFILVSFSSYTSIAQNIDVNSTMGLPRVDDVNNITGETAANIGNIVYNTTDNLIYRYDGTNWIPSTDDQFDDEVPLRTPTDVNNQATDPNAGNETNLQEVIQAITPITSKNGRVFYPPSIQIDASTIGGPFMLNLYDEYVTQHTGAGIIRSEDGAGVFAPNIPIYDVDELYYYVTFADPAVFGNISIDGDTGIMTYNIIGQPIDFNSLINVVFVVK